jgi:NADPH:quinone reductase-like Zn-dependent oxidoreductase
VKAAVVTSYGGPDVLQLQHVPDLAPGAGQLRVRVKAIGLNFADMFGRLGVYPGTPKPPFIPGMEFSGDVIDVGEGVTLFAPGDRVMGFSKLGSHAEQVVVSETKAIRFPQSMSYEEAASFLVTNLSAYHGIVRLANTRSGEKLLVHAAAGGVGLAAVQMGKHLGAEIFGTAGSEQKTALARSYGSDHVFDYTKVDFEKRIRVLTRSYGVDVVMDSVGGEVFRKSWQLLAPMGRYVLYGVSAVTGKGALSRLKAAAVFSLMRPIFPPSLLSANKGIFGFNLGLLTDKDAYFREAVTDLLRWHARGVLKTLIGRVFSFDEIVEAHRFLQGRESVGKVVVRID